MTFRSFARTAFLLIGGGLLLALLWVASLSWEDPAEYFGRKRGELTRSTLQPSGGDSLNDRYWLTLENDKGLKVESGLLVPRQAKGTKLPAIVLLGGKMTGKYAVEYALNIRDVILVAPDYPFQARESYTVPQFLGDVPDIRRGLFDMFPSVMLVTDYLRSRDDVDSTRVILLGYSFGAPFVPCLVANDHRYAVAAIVYGGGDLHSLIRHNVRRFKGPLVSECAGLLSAFLLHPLEPLRYAGMISPTPLLMINGVADEQIPSENVRMLYTAAREPKKLIWLESRHVNPSNVELTRQIIDTLRQELARAGVLDSVRHVDALRRIPGGR